MRIPHVDTVRSHQHSTQGQSPLPHPAGYATLDAAHFMIGFLVCKGRVLAHPSCHPPVSVSPLWQDCADSGDCHSTGARPGSNVYRMYNDVYFLVRQRVAIIWIPTIQNNCLLLHVWIYLHSSISFPLCTKSEYYQPLQ